MGTSLYILLTKVRPHGPRARPPLLPTALPSLIGYPTYVSYQHRACAVRSWRFRPHAVVAHIALGQPLLTRGYNALTVTAWAYAMGAVLAGLGRAQGAEGTSL